MSSVSAINIVNAALALCNARSTITSFSESNPETGQANLWYDRERLWLLREHRWNFARFQAPLTLLFTAPGVDAQPATGLPWPFMPWAYAYAYPSDCAHFDYILPTYNGAPIQAYPNALPQPTVPFKVGGMQNQSDQAIEVIMTSQTAAYGVYTRDITNPQLFDSQFVEAFTCRLAFRFAVPLSGSPQIQASSFADAQRVLDQAKARDGNEGITVDNHTPSWIRTRQGYGAGGYMGPLGGAGWSLGDWGDLGGDGWGY